jgi:hypothetical protein
LFLKLRIAPKKQQPSKQLNPISLGNCTLLPKLWIVAEKQTAYSIPKSRKRERERELNLVRLDTDLHSIVNHTLDCHHDLHDSNSPSPSSARSGDWMGLMYRVRKHFGGLLGFEVLYYKVFCPFLIKFKIFHEDGEHFYFKGTFYSAKWRSMEMHEHKIENFFAQLFFKSCAISSYSLNLLTYLA